MLHAEPLGAQASSILKKWSVAYLTRFFSVFDTGIAMTILLFVSRFMCDTLCNIQTILVNSRIR